MSAATSDEGVRRRLEAIGTLAALVRSDPDAYKSCAALIEDLWGEIQIYMAGSLEAGRDADMRFVAALGASLRTEQT